MCVSASWHTSHASVLKIFTSADREMRMQRWKRRWPSTYCTLPYHSESRNDAIDPHECELCFWVCGFRVVLMLFFATDEQITVTRRPPSSEPCQVAVYDVGEDGCIGRRRRGNEGVCEHTLQHSNFSDECQPSRSSRIMPALRHALWAGE